MKRLLLLCFIIFFIQTTIFSQNQTSTNDAFKQLELKLKSNKDSKSVQKIISDFLKNAKKKDDHLLIAHGYYLLSKYGDTYNLKYADSLTTITHNIQHFDYPAEGYIIKGNYYYEIAAYDKALDNYVHALKYATKEENNIQQLRIKFNIGLIKNNLGNVEEAIQNFKESIEYIEKNNVQKKYPRFYVASLYALADTYISLKYVDSSALYTAKGIKISLQDNNTTFYSYLVAHAGVNKFYLSQYAQAIDSLQKGKKLLRVKKNNDIRIAICDFYIGKSLFNLGKRDESVLYFKKVDSILRITKDITPNLLETYTYLINYYDKKDDSDNQLLYINRLLKMDSIRDKVYKNLTNTINKEYDTKILLSEKQKIITHLKDQSHINKKMIIFFMALSIAFLTILTYYFKRNIKNKKRFQKLIVDQEKKQELKNQVESKPTIIISKDKIQEKARELDIPDIIVEEILGKLDHFESSQRFLKKTYTLSSLAKELKTNSSYLSKVINVKKETSFAQYLNNLKIEAAIPALTENAKLRSYTIKAIAKDFGFNTAQSFTNAFHKSTGIYPSYFIKQLNSNNNKHLKLNLDDEIYK